MDTEQIGPSPVVKRCCRSSKPPPVMIAVQLAPSPSISRTLIS